MGNVGSRPWQILHEYPAPQPEPIENIPFKINIREEVEAENEIIAVFLNIVSTKEWKRLPVTYKRVGCGIALDILIPTILYFIRARRISREPLGPQENHYLHVLELNVPLMEEWAQMLEQEPHEKSNPKNRKRYLRNQMVSITSIMNQIQPVWIDWLTKTSFNLIHDAFRSSVYDRLTEAILYCILILSKWDVPPNPHINLESCDIYGVGRNQDAGIECYYSVRPSYVLNPISLFQDHINNAKHWLGVWWTEFKNAMAIAHQDRYIR